MAKKESTTSSPKGMCEKLFDAFNPASRPHRHPALHHQEPGATTNPSQAQPNHSLDSGINEPRPQKAVPTPVNPGPPSPPRPPIPSVQIQKATPKAVTIRQPSQSKKNINEKVEDYIKRARERMRAVSGVGRAHPSK